MSIEYTVISEKSPSTDFSLVPKIGGIAIGAAAISADVDLDYVTTYFRCGDTAANKTLVLEGADGNPVVIFNMVTGEIITFATKKILYQATIGATTYTTDIVNLTWFGGN